MKTRILKKVNQRVRIVKNDDMYEVQVRNTIGFGRNFGEWRTENIFSKLSKALKRKEVHVVMVIMRELGYRNEFVKRRTTRKRKLGLIW
jgi:hypothetical protein